MSRTPEEMLASIPTQHVHLLEASLRAPSAHNAQPWRIHPTGDGTTYDIHYDQHPGLPFDRDDKDAYLTMGAFVETMVLEAPNYGLGVAVAPRLSRSGQDIFIAQVQISPARPSEPRDPLADWIGRRVTNRNRFDNTPIPDSLRLRLAQLGNVVLRSTELAGIIEEASQDAWGDRQFVHDLQMWLRADRHEPDGLTASSMNLSRPEMFALKFAFWRGRFKSGLMKRIFASSEVSLFKSAPEAAVLTVQEPTPAALFDAGRKLLRSWVEITRAGYSYQPFSVAVDQESTIPQVQEKAHSGYPVALYRIGHAKRQPRFGSNRRGLLNSLQNSRPSQTD